MRNAAAARKVVSYYTAGDITISRKCCEGEGSEQENLRGRGGGGKICTDYGETAALLIPIDRSLLPQ